MARRLDPDENALWKKVAATVKPLAKAKAPLAPVAPPTIRPPQSTLRNTAIPAAPARPAAKLPQPRRTHSAATLDGHWDRRLRKGLVRPDLSIDLHGHTLVSAQALLDDAIARAVIRSARVLLVVAGRLRPGADRLPQMHGDPRPRGAIRASLPDWLAHSPHADQIVALRPAHVSHGGAGAVYVILRRARDD
ncbi:MULTISPECIES: Smr/MutS family protein [unclassified Sphingopyxis]|uniref:Smr/MutS family protein n=1 Tax=unclassified Sphingopyxis TaxID=2614943 RepID=UPI0028610490|nr:MULTISPECIES: Smr/MutS family protein [unclassified Sphingopyxis]MDR6833734.1 DNA-nicking Smr family endonuclease [Sphingopyxis sp. BE122]MDR7226003.1 DNA-nicking Smr family endonuclease [Sphingopyxis sp. BE259]